MSNHKTDRLERSIQAKRNLLAIRRAKLAEVLLWSKDPQAVRVVFEHRDGQRTIQNSNTTSKIFDLAIQEARMRVDQAMADLNESLLRLQKEQVAEPPAPPKPKLTAPKAFHDWFASQIIPPPPPIGRISIPHGCVFLGGHTLDEIFNMPSDAELQERVDSVIAFMRNYGLPPEATTKAKPEINLKDSGVEEAKLHYFLSGLKAIDGMTKVPKVQPGAKIVCPNLDKPDVWFAKTKYGTKVRIIQTADGLIVTDKLSDDEDPHWALV